MMIDIEPLTMRPPKPMPVPRRDDLRSSYAWHPNFVHEDHPNVVLRVTKSSLSTFQFCQQQYFAKYVLGVKEPQNDNMLRGTNVHDAYEYILDHVLDVEKAMQIRDEKGYNALEEYFQTLIPESQVSKGWDDEIAQHTGEEYGLDEEKHLARLMTAEAQRFMTCDPEYFKPLGNERGVDALIDLDVNGTKVTIHASGIIDRLFVAPNGELHIHELKTGEWKGNHGDAKYKGMAKEMAYYVWLLRKSDDPELGGANIQHWGWDHTKGYKDSQRDTIYRFVEGAKTKIVMEMLDDLTALVAAHLRYTGDFNGKHFEVKSSHAERYICEPWCKVKGYCPKYNRSQMPYEMRKIAEGN